MYDHLRLNTTFLNRRIRELNLKHWWIADQLGVAKLTLNRWVNGKVSKIRYDNALALGKLLDCPYELLTADETSIYISETKKQDALTYLLSDTFYSLMNSSHQLAHFDNVILNHFDKTTDDKLVAKMSVRLATSAMAQQNITNLMEWSKRALVLSAKHQLSDVFLQASIYQSYGQLRLGELTTAFKTLNDLQNTFNDDDDFFYSEINSLKALALRDFADYGKCLTLSEKALKLIQNTHPQKASTYLLRHAQNYYYAGLYEKAYEVGKEALRSWQECRGSVLVPLMFSSFLVECALNMNDKTLIQQHSTDLEKVPTESNTVHMIGYLRAKGRLLGYQEDYAESIDLLKQAFKRYTGMVSYQLEMAGEIIKMATLSNDFEGQTYWSKIARDLSKAYS